MNKSIKFLLFITIALLPSLAFAQAGKIFGKVVDAQTGEGLIGANVQIVGTNYGAATDVKGEFIILNITPGTYNIKARYIGYREQVSQNIKVYVNLTTEVNFGLQTEEFTTDVIVVQAPKPLINKNITNSTDIKKAEDIENLPIRGVNAIVATSAGVVEQGGNIFVRGSRSDGVAFYVDGVLVTDPVFGGSTSGVINNAIEEIQVQAGGYSAEFGGANGGIISTQTRTGRDNYQITGEAITDNFVGVGNKFLDTYSYGYSEYALTIGGPVIPGYKDLKFFFAANNIFQRSGAAFYRGLQMDNVFDPALGANSDTLDFNYPDGYRINAPRTSTQLQGNLTFDLNPLTFRVNANYVGGWSRGGAGIAAFAAQKSARLTEYERISGSLKATHVLAANAFYDVIVNYYSDLEFFMDPYFKHNVAAYGDSIANAKIGRNLQGDSDNFAHTKLYGFDFYNQNEWLSGYEKRKYSTIGGKFNFLYQLGKNHEFKTGVEYTTHTIRRYALGGNAFAVSNLARAVADGSVNDVYSRLDNYGYDVYGNESDKGLDAAKNPVFAAFYIQDKMEYSDLVFNIGFRYDYIDIDGEVFKNPSNIDFNDAGEIDQNSLETLKPIDFVSPRIGVSFPVTDRTVFHAQYGKFIQQSRLRDVYQGYSVVADNIKGGFAISAPVGFGVRPERTTQYEIGFKQQLGESFAFDLTGFYKDIKDQVQIRSIFADADAEHKQYYAWVNGDFSTTKGIEVKLDLRRTDRISATVDYTYSDAQGTGSNPSTAFRTIWQSPTGTPYFPQQVTPLDFNQAHKGNINLDYRFGKDDGPELFGSKFLSDFGMNFLFSFASGFNYTRWEGYANARTPLEPLNNSTTPWTYQIDARIDKSFSLGPISLNVYLWIVNLLNKQNVVSVFNNTGDAYDDGYLSSDAGQSQYNNYKLNYGQKYADTYAKLYRALNYASGNFGTPRQIRLGVKINY